MIAANLPALVVVLPLLAALLCPLVGAPRRSWALAVVVTALSLAGSIAIMLRVLDEGRHVIAEAMENGLLGPDASIAVRARIRSMVEGCPYETIVGALGGMRDRPDRTATLRSVRVPAAVIVGEMDAVTPPEEAAAMAEILPDAGLTVVPGAGHVSPIESPDAVNVALRSLIERAAAPAL